MKHLIFTSLTIFLLLGCTERPANIESTSFMYHARECNYAWVDHLKRTPMPDSGMEDSYKIDPLMGATEVSAKNYLLAINTCNVNKDRIPWEGYINHTYSAEYNPIHECPFKLLAHTTNSLEDAPDLELERIIKRVNDEYYTKSGSGALYLNLEHVDYRTSLLTGLKITCNKTLFGINPGEPLNNFMQLLYLGDNTSFIIASNKQLVTSDGSKIRGMSLSNYLNYEPYAPSFLVLQFKSIPAEIPLEVIFSIELEINGVKVITDTSKVIKLTT